MQVSSILFPSFDHLFLMQNRDSTRKLTCLGKLVTMIIAHDYPKKGTKQKTKKETGVRKGKRSLLACHTSHKCSIEASHNSVKFKFGIKVIEFHAPSYEMIQQF